MASLAPIICLLLVHANKLDQSIKTALLLHTLPILFEQMQHVPLYGL